RLVGVLDALYAGNPEVRGKLGAVSAALQPQHTDADVIDLLNREIFVPMDRRADERIQRAALRASLGVAACPHPALDALVVLGISVALVKDLMQIYGLRHSARAVWRIISHVLFSASSTAVMSTVVEFAMQAAQDRIAAAVVGTAGEALVVARRTFALGMLAKEEIRPLPAPR
ncbi:MAG: YcjF family protein, partial [Reyranella sp.]|nr:YcjF family protein [Reyranella sp.]